MISKTTQSLTKLLLRMSSLLSCVPWEDGGGADKVMLVGRKSLLKFYFNSSVFIAYNIYVVFQFPATCKEKHSLAFLRGIMHFIGVSVIVLSSLVGCIQFMLSGDEIMGQFNDAFSYHQSFAAQFCRRDILKSGGFNCGFEPWMKMFIYGSPITSLVGLPIFAMRIPDLKVFLSSMFLSYLNSGGFLANLLFLVLTGVHTWIYTCAVVMIINSSMLLIPQLCQMSVVLREIRYLYKSVKKSVTGLHIFIHSRN
ncbi:uncharacterized protein LOC118435965 [Folsomia candida]|uniref:uncharacterized protein LOC118435965 n=1 Tax=Folsomia candida TaxID=158441 RepID=UPI0016054C7C|nr:uncharacterized protein LOC118435965 [Folsomia candida]